MTEAEHNAYWMGVKFRAETTLARIAREPRPETQSEVEDLVEMIHRKGTWRESIQANIAAAEWAQACNELHYMKKAS